MKDITKEKVKDITIIILKIIAAAGLVSVAAVAPNALQALGIFQKRQTYYANQKIATLISRGYLAVQMRNKAKSLYLTDRGRIFLRKLEIKNIKKPRWDRKWRIVMFDIWEKRRYARVLFRKELSEFGFVQLQKSVWITPYECEEYIELLKTDLRIRKGVLYIEVDKIDNEVKLKKAFQLENKF